MPRIVTRNPQNFQVNENVEINEYSHMQQLGVEIIQLASDQGFINNDIAEQLLMQEIDFDQLPPLKLKRKNARIWPQRNIEVTASSQ